MRQKNSVLIALLLWTCALLTVGPLPAEDIPAPPDVAAPPADAERTASGLASKVLEAGRGTEKPVAADTVTVHYTGWTTDGKMFDSSSKRGEPSSFPLNRVIDGWTEGLQLMVEGETRRFWIPEELAYKGRPGRPQGMLVFDVELLSIDKAPEAPADVSEIPGDAEVTESGLASKVLTPGPGTGEPPASTDTVQVHYTGWTTDGTLFDSSVSRGQPVSLVVEKAAMEGWKEGLQLMGVGEKRRFWIPGNLAFVNQPSRPQGMVVFDIELLEILRAPKVPEDVAAPPADAEVGKGGLASKVLKAGTGSEHPKARSRVTVHYTGWTTDGQMFDSSVTRGEPATFGLDQVIKGWTQGVQLMVVGEKRRFWIPEKLAYKGQRGAPRGMLVFDIELLAIE